MPLTPESMYSVVRIVGDAHDSDGSPIRKAIGTGFCVYVPSEAHPDVRYGYVLTAHHVIKDQKNIELEIPNPFEDGALYPRLKMAKWCQPIQELDLAVAHIKPSFNIQALEFGYHIIQDLKFPLGANFFYIGLLDPLNRPMARSGIIGALDQTGILHEGSYTYTAHLADCRSYGGFSGSPCFVAYPIINLEAYTLPSALKISPSELPNEIGSISYLHLLCGMFTQHLNSKNADRIVSRTGVGIILRSQEIVEALMTESMKTERELWDTEKRIDNKEIDDEEDRLENASAIGDEFDNFESLTKKVIQVPKPEIDEKRKKN
jgi:hypothetical protein